MTCEKCGHEIPEGSRFCLNCRASTETSASVEASHLDEHNVPKSKKQGSKKVLIALLAVVAVLACITTAALFRGMQALTETQLYNETLGVRLKLGMSKSRVDHLLGEPELAGDAYHYPSLYAYYYRGKLAGMYVPAFAEGWHTVGGVATETTTDELQEVLGEPYTTSEDGRWWYYSRGNGMAGFEIFGDEIGSIYIYDANWPGA